MKRNIVWFIAALIAAMLAPLATAEAYTIQAPVGQNPGYSRTYSYTVTTVGPNGQVQGPTVQYGSPANRALPAETQRQSTQPRVQVAQQYYPNYPRQAYPAVRNGYYRAPQSTYYTNPYQSRYYGAPNYYQGYSYNNGWGSSLQGCAPGRA